jgi:hypothetical protein
VLNGVDEGFGGDTRVFWCFHIENMLAVLSCSSKITQN